jgi:hypothetical protein
MKEQLTTILDAMRAAQAELADYLVSADRNAELTIAKLVGILDRREVVRAMQLLPRLRASGRCAAKNVCRGELMGRNRLCEINRRVRNTA